MGFRGQQNMNGPRTWCQDGGRTVRTDPLGSVAVVYAAHLMGAILRCQCDVNRPSDQMVPGPSAKSWMTGLGAAVGWVVLCARPWRWRQRNVSGKVVARRLHRTSQYLRASSGVGWATIFGNQAKGTASGPGASIYWAALLYGIPTIRTLPAERCHPFNLETGVWSLEGMGVGRGFPFVRRVPAGERSKERSIAISQQGVGIANKTGN